jgi:hypothetical protein
MQNNEELNNNELNEELNDDLSFLSTGTESSKYDKLYFAKLYTKKGTKPHFKFQRAVEGKIIDVKGETQSISGTLKKITFPTFEFEGNQIKTVRFFLETLNNEGKLTAISFGCGWNQVLQNLVNCLLNLNEPVTALQISVYVGDNGYNKSMLRINGKKPSWKYQVAELNDKKEKIFNKKGELVKTEIGDLIDFLEAELKAKVPTLLPNFHPEDEPTVAKHQVNFVELPIDSVLGEKPAPEKDEEMDEFFDFTKE